jgi:hypothetical protein
MAIEPLIAPELKYDGLVATQWTVALAHETGVGMDSPFMTTETWGLNMPIIHLENLELARGYRRLSVPKVTLDISWPENCDHLDVCQREMHAWGGIVGRR